MKAKPTTEVFNALLKAYQTSVLHGEDANARRILEHIKEFNKSLYVELPKSRNTLHETQLKIMRLAMNEDINEMTLNEIGNKIGDDSPYRQKIKHHRDQLVKHGLLDKDYYLTDRAMSLLEQK